MPTYTWEGKSGFGEIKKGELVAENPAIARIQLRKLRITPTRIRPKKDEGAMNFSLRRKVPEKSIVIFTRQFATMINAGLPLVQCLRILATQQENPAFGRIISQVKSDVESGQSLAEALKKHPKIFNDLYINLVEAGEAGGILDVILSRLSTYIEKLQKLKKKVKGALVYPAVIISVAVLVMAIILIFVIPVFEKMFSDFGHALPAPTQFVIGLSRFVKNNIFYLLIALGGLVFLLRQFYRTSSDPYCVKWRWPNSPAPSEPWSAAAFPSWRPWILSPVRPETR
jgi:type IV pilus assembly protein PilC